jgi:hypothetical protein
LPTIQSDDEDGKTLIVPEAAQELPQFAAQQQLLLQLQLQPAETKTKQHRKRLAMLGDLSVLGSMSARKRRRRGMSVSLSPTIQRTRCRSGEKSTPAPGFYAETPTRGLCRGLLNWSARPSALDLDNVPLALNLVKGPLGHGHRRL